MRDRVVVIGGGIVGMSCAFFARREGLDVTLVDPDEPEARASFGNAGVIALCEQLPLATPELFRQLPALLAASHGPLDVRWRDLPALSPWLWRFYRASAPEAIRTAIDGLSALMAGALPAHFELADAAGARDLIGQTGWIKASQRAQPAVSAKEHELLTGLGVGMQSLTLAELNDLAPGLRDVFGAATLFTDCHRVVNPGAYLDRLTAACRAMGVVFVRGRVVGFDFEDGAVRGVSVAGETKRLDAQAVVLAGGAHSARLAARLGDTVPLETERGYHLMIDVSDRPRAPFLHAPLFWQEKSIVLSPMQHGLRMTNGTELAALDAPARFDKIERTFASMQSDVPALMNATVKSRWMGLRPSMPDSLPVIGRSARHRNCLLAFGHGHLGLTLGPFTGQLIASQLAGRRTPIDLAAFSPARFAHPPARKPARPTATTSSHTHTKGKNA